MTETTQTTAPSTPEAADPAAAIERAANDGRTGISIPGDQVLQALNRLVATSALDDAGKSTVLWFYGHCRDAGMSLAEAGSCIDRDASTIYRLFVGRYGAGYGNLLAAIARYRKIAEQRAKRKAIGYIETSTWRKVSTVCNAALFDGLPAYIYGDSQIGKTAALLEYQRRNNHGQTRYVRMPAAPSLPLVLAYIAEGCHISGRLNSHDLRRRLVNALDDKSLLILDEFHQILIGAGDLLARKIVETVRELYDRSGCGIVMAGTRVLRDELEKGRQALVYEQFRRRGMIELVLPSTPPRSDIVKIAASFGLPEPGDAEMETIHDMLKSSGLGKYIKFLQLAHGLAVGRKQQLTWSHFTQAHRSIAALSRG